MPGDEPATLVRVTRNEQDIQRLFDKFGEAISMMHRIDKRLEGLWGKVTGIVLGMSILVGVIMKLVDKLPWP